jgi:hypothetical protein
MMIAYIDPGTGSIVVQTVITIFVGVSFALKMFWGRIVGLFRRTKPVAPGGDESQKRD